MEGIRPGFAKEDAASSQKSGCYLRSSKEKGFDPKFNYIVPLRQIDYQIVIVNGLINVTLVQTYHNPTDKYIEVVYSMPTDPNCCYYKFEVKFNNVLVAGVVK